MEGNRSILFQLLKLLGKNLTIPLHEDFKGVQNSCPGAGACGGMYTATMSSAIERMSLPYSSSNPALSPEKKTRVLRCRKAIKILLEKISNQEIS
jgi:dihydroxy-acid dehydratase